MRRDFLLSTCWTEICWGEMEVAESWCPLEDGMALWVWGLATLGWGVGLQRLLAFHRVKGWVDEALLSV